MQPQQQQQLDNQYLSLQLQQKIRDLESNFIDYKSSLERRFQEFISEKPQNLRQSLKVLEDKDSTLKQDQKYFQNSIQDQLSVLQTNFDISLKKNQENLQNQDQKIQELTFKNQRLSKVLEDLLTRNQFSQNQQQLALKQSENIQKHTQQNLTDNMLQEQQNLKFQIYDEKLKQFETAQKRLRQQLDQKDAEMQKMVEKSKEIFSLEQQNSQKQIKNIEQFNLEKFLTETDYIKNLITGLERKLEKELHERLQQTYENNTNMDQKMLNFKEDVMNDEKKLLLNYQKQNQ